jgi:hypothetical protein
MRRGKWFPPASKIAPSNAMDDVMRLLSTQQNIHTNHSTASTATVTRYEFRASNDLCQCAETLQFSIWKISAEINPCIRFVALESGYECRSRFKIVRLIQECGTGGRNFPASLITPQRAHLSQSPDYLSAPNTHCTLPATAASLHPAHCVTCQCLGWACSGPASVCSVPFA